MRNPRGNEILHLAGAVSHDFTPVALQKNLRCVNDELSDQKYHGSSTRGLEGKFREFFERNCHSFTEFSFPNYANFTHVYLSFVQKKSREWNTFGGFHPFCLFDSASLKTIIIINNGVS